MIEYPFLPSITSLKNDDTGPLTRNFFVVRYQQNMFVTYNLVIQVSLFKINF